MKTLLALSVYDGYGEYIGRLEAYNGDAENYALSFRPEQNAELTKEDMEDILEVIITDTRLKGSK